MRDVSEVHQQNDVFCGCLKILSVISYFCPFIRRDESSPFFIGPSISYYRRAAAADELRRTIRSEKTMKSENKNGKLWQTVRVNIEKINIWF